LFQLQSLAESGELDLPHTSSINDYAFTDSIVAQEVDMEDVDVGLSPNVRTYTMVMTAWANAVTDDDSGIEAAIRCENILMEMEKQGETNLLVRPNLVAYVTAISAWARTTRGGGGDNNNNIAASHAEFILNRMIDLYYNHETLDLPALDGDIVNANHDAPFNAVITCYARCADPNSTERAFAILERLIVSPIRPTVMTFNSVLDVCAKHGKPDRALDVLDKMKEMSIRPDSTSYDTVLNAFGRCSHPDSANKAYDFLCQLENSPDEYNYKPSIVSYSTVINAFARVSGNESSSYGGLVAVKKAKEIYDRLIYQMENGLIHGIVDPFANSCLLNCCANVYGCESDKQAALVIAVSISMLFFTSKFRCFRFWYISLCTDTILFDLD
jgi:pentatricopeptide repeat protein